MVHVRRTILADSGGVDTAGVATEIISDLEGHGDRLLVDGRFQLDLVASCDVDGVANGQLEGGGVDSADLIYSFIRVCLLSGYTTGGEDVLKGVGGQATITAVVVEFTGAVNELLLSVGLQDTIGDEVSRLEAANG